MSKQEKLPAKFLPLSYESGILFTSFKSESGDRYGFPGNSSGELKPTNCLSDLYWSESDADNVGQVKELYKYVAEATNQHEALLAVAEAAKFAQKWNLMQIEKHKTSPFPLQLESALSKALSRLASI